MIQTYTEYGVSESHQRLRGSQEIQLEGIKTPFIEVTIEKLQQRKACITHHSTTMCARACVNNINIHKLEQ